MICALKLLALQNFFVAGRYFWKQVQVFNVGYISYVLTNEEYAGAGYYLAPHKEGSSKFWFDLDLPDLIS